MATSLDPDMDFPDLSVMLEQTLESEICEYERDSSIDQPPYVDSSVEGSLCANYLAAERNVAVPKEVKPTNEAEVSSQVSEENNFYETYIRENKRERLKSAKCTVCDIQLSNSNANTHPVLDVLVCKSCREVYADGQFTQSDGTDDYCRWCAEGGVQICCDKCSNVFCKDCLGRNLGSPSVEEIEQSGQWICLVCNTSPIWNLRAQCRWFMTANLEKPEEQSSEDGSETSSEWASNIVQSAEEIGTSYVQNIQHIKENFISARRTGDEDFLALLSRVLDQTMSSMKQLKDKLADNSKLKVNPSDSLHEETVPSGEGKADTIEPRLILKVKNFRGTNKQDGYYAEISHSPKPKAALLKDHKTLQEKGKACNIPARASDSTQASKVPDSQNDDEVDTPVAEQTTVLAEPVTDTLEDSMDDFFDMAQAAMEKSENSPQSPLLPETESRDELSGAAKVDPNDAARQQLLTISDSDSVASLTSSTPRIKKTRQRTEEVNGVKSKSKSSASKGKETASKAAPVKDAKAKKDLDSDSDSAIEKRIKRLENLSVAKSKTSDGGSVSSLATKIKAKREKKRKAAPVFSDDSDEESNTEDGEESTTLENKSTDGKPLVDSKEKARDELLAMSSDSSSDDELSASEAKKGKKKGSATKKEKKVFDSDDDFETKDNELDPEAAELLNLPVKDKHSEETKESKKDRGEETKKKENDEKKKRPKRRIKSESESEACSDSDFESERSEKKDDSAESSDNSQPKPKRRRRIKAASSSGSGSDSDVKVLNDSQRSGGKGRKNIKKIIKDKNLKNETKEAVREEQERIKRIAERQNFYNESFKDDYMTNARIEKLVLDFDPDSKKELVSVDKRLVEKLKPHQAKGVKFMWDACFESLERIKVHHGSGCILAHCMGLGKTLQVVTLVHTILSNPACNVKKVLVVCPLSTVLNWVNEFKTWLVDDMEPDVYELANVKQNDMRMYHVRMWSQNGGVLVMGYEMYRNITNEKNKRVKAKYREIFQRGLVEPGPDLVVCDEGHLLKNEASALSKAMNRIATRRRIVLTGTPLQNSLSEYHCMIQFVKPSLLGTRREFTNRFANPIKNGQCADSTEHDVRIMKRRAHVLHKKLEGCVQRFDYSVLTPFLPPKHEYVVSVKLSDLQIKMYGHYLEKCARGGPNASMPAGRGKGSGLFADFQELGKIWTHPRALQLAQIRREQRATGDTEDSMDDFIDDDSGSEKEEVVCLDSDGESNEEAEEENTGIAWKSRTRAGRGNQPAPEEDLSTVVTSNCWWSQFVTEDDMEKIEHSGKLLLLREILRKCELIGDKVLVFSQSLVSLDLIEEFLHLEDQSRQEQEYANDGEDYPSGNWRLNLDYFRFDGSTSAELRKNWCNSFNSPKNTRARLFLISTRAGGLGINMVAANRVIIFDASWNPSHDVQSIFRVYRFGQKKPCYIYRFLAQGTMEEKIYDRQVTKLSLSCRVVDEQQIERHFNASDLAELYRFDSDSHTRRPTPMVPKDRLLAELMMAQKQWIATFHEHDSLLQNKSEEELNEDERKAAWEDYENENRGILTNPLLDASGSAGLENQMQMLAGRQVAGIPLTHLASMIRSNNPAISAPELMQRLQLTVEQLQNLSVQHYTAMAAASGLGINQQPMDVQRLLLQRQQAMEQVKNQYPGVAMQSLIQAATMGGANAAGPSRVVQSAAPARRGRPPIGPYQRTDMGYPPIRPNILSSTSRVTPSGKNPPGNKP